MTSFKVYVVDDDPVIQDVMQAVLEPDCLVISFDSAEACLVSLQENLPDMILLDVGLPGMDGYTLCRHIKDDSRLRSIPVTFISGNDTIEARIDGYNAGGEDFIVKPFEPEEVLRKVRVAQAIIANHKSLAEQAEQAEMLSSLALASMDEAGIVLQCMSKLLACETEQEVAQCLLDVLRNYRLEGVVQLRTCHQTLTVSPAGINLPLETSVMDHVKTLGRIFEFHNRGVHNFERSTIMVNNLPLSDPEYCGRLRDNLSIAAMGADSRLRAMETEIANRQHKEGILDALSEMRQTIDSLHQAHEMDRNQSSQLLIDLEDRLIKSFVHLGLTDNQEKFLEDLIKDFSVQLVQIIDRGGEAAEALQYIGRRLGSLVRT